MDYNFKKEHHRKIGLILKALNKDFFKENKIFFAGGTLLSLLFNEYRISTDIDFMTSSDDGYKNFRGAILNNNWSHILHGKNIEVDVENVKKDQYAVRAKIYVDGTLIKFEVLKDKSVLLEENNIIFDDLHCCTKKDMFTLKLLANLDRAGVPSQVGKNIIDLSMLAYDFQKIPNEYFDTVYKISNKEEIKQSFLIGYKDLHKNIEQYAKALDISLEDKQKIKEGLNILKNKFYPNNRHNKNLREELIQRRKHSI